MSNQIDVNQLSNALQQKVDLPSGKSQADIDYVIEWQTPTAENNYTWYRLYKSGWIEQGGPYTASGTLTYIKEMIDTNYTLEFFPHMNIDSMIYWSDFGFNKTTTGCTMRNTSPNGGDWKVEGMAAQT